MRFPKWYHLRAGDALAARMLLEGDGASIRAVRISGPPGVGKTSFAKALAETWEAEEVYFLAHHWTSEEDLFVKLDPARVAALAGGQRVELEDAYRPGVLLRATLASQEGPTVLTLDEWDKAPERADALLLDFLQTGRVLGPFGEEWRANPSRLAVVITDNGMRELAEPLLRRLFRLDMAFLPPNVEADIIRKKTGVPTGTARAITAFLWAVRREGETSPSLQEGTRVAENLPLCRSHKDAALLVKGLVCKTEADWEALTKKFPNPGATLWGEWLRGRREKHE